MKKISKIIVCFVSTIEKHLQSNQYPDLIFEIRHIRTKYVYFLFQLNFDFGFFIKPWRSRLCIWLIEWCLTPLLTVFQSYHGDSSHYSCFPGFTSTRLGSEVSCPRTLPRKNPEDPVRLEPRTPGLRFKHFTTEPRRTLCVSEQFCKKRMDLDCNFWDSLSFKLPTVGEVWWPHQQPTNHSAWVQRSR